jgi:hypothetical protein
MLIGVDNHPSFQTIAFLMDETGECGEQELNHSSGQAGKFYRDLQQRGIRVRGAVVVDAEVNKEQGRPLIGVNGAVRSKED